MKIIYLHQYFKFPDETGGTRSYDLATSFARKGYSVVIVTATSDQEFNTKRRWTITKRAGLEVHYIYIPYDNHLSYIQRTLIFFKFLWFSSFRLLKLHADVVLATSTPLTIGIPALIKKWFGGTPFIFEVRDVWPDAVIAIGAVKNKWIQKLLYSLEKLVYKNAVAIVPLSTDMQKSILRRYPNFNEKTSIVIENISEINRFQEDRRKIDLEKQISFQPRFSVLYAGTFGKVNGIHKIIELAKETTLLDPKLVYLLLGSGAEKDAVRTQAEKAGVLNKTVFILDPISKKELPLWYNAVSMGSSFVIDIPELWANSANKFFDTLAAGKPILINYEGWQADVIRDHDCGYVLPFEISTKIAENFVVYTQNIELFTYQRKNALNLATERYSLEKASEKYVKILEKTIRKSHV